MSNHQENAGTARRLPIAVRIAASVSLLMLISVAVMAVFLLNNQSRLIGAHAYDYRTLIAEQLAGIAVEPLFTDERYELQALVKTVNRNEQVLGSAIFDIDGKRIASAGFSPQSERLNFKQPYQELHGLNDLLISQDAPISVHIEPIRFKGATAGYAVVSFSQAALLQSHNKSMTLLGGLTLLLMAIVCACAMYLGRNVSRPLDVLVAASRNISEGKFEQISEIRDDEFGQLISAINGMSNDLKEKNEIESTMSRILHQNVASKVIKKNGRVTTGGEQVYASVLFADIVGFTNISEKLSPKEVSELLNEYFTYLSACARFYFGTIDKFIGDCVMVIFGAPKEDPLHEYHAVCCGVLMQKLIKQLNEKRRAEGKQVVDIKIGINSGTMLAGFLGSDERLEYTVVGDAVNLASRLCSEASRNQVIVEESLLQNVDKDYKITSNGEKAIRLRGKTHPVTIYNVCDIEQATGLAMDGLIEDMLLNEKVA